MALSGKLAAAVSAAKSCPVLQAPSGAREGRRGGPSGDRPREGSPGVLPDDSEKPRRTSVIQKHLRKLYFPKTGAAFARLTAPQRLQLSQIRSRLGVPTSPGRRPARPAKDAGGARSRWQLPSHPPALRRRGQRLRHVPASRSQNARDWLAALPVVRGGSDARRLARLLVVAAAAARAARARRGSRWWRRRNGRRLPVS